jgi:hypothetical protein
MIFYKASPIGIKDLYCKGINPLRCVVCQENKKLEGKMTCGDYSCITELRLFKNTQSKQKECSHLESGFGKDKIYCKKCMKVLTAKDLQRRVC